jgi:Holliday junction resolvasome RuvABC endonuclease subunit
MRRIKKILGEIRKLIAGEYSMKPYTKAGLVDIEGFSFGFMNTQAHKIGGLGHLVRYMVWSHEIPYLIVSPAEVKKFATGKSKAEKNQMLKECLRRFKQDFNDDNEADAYILAMIGRAYVNCMTHFVASWARRILMRISIRSRSTGNCKEIPNPGSVNGCTMR